MEERAHSTSLPGSSSYASPTLVRTRSGNSVRRTKRFGSAKVDAETSSVIVDDESSALVQIEERTLTWQQTTALLLIEYVVLAILGEFACAHGRAALKHTRSFPVLVPNSRYESRLFTAGRSSSQSDLGCVGMAGGMIATLVIGLR